MTKNTFKSKSLILAFMLFTLVFSSFATALNPFPVLAQPFNGIPSIPDGSPDFPKINLIEKHYNYNPSIGGWEIDTTKSTDSFQEKYCSDLYSQGIKGISDYGDGISNNVIRAIESDPVMSADTSFQVGINSISYYYRDCFMQNQNAKNFPSEYATTLPGSPKNNTDYNAFRITSQDTPYSESLFTPANNPVYAYYFQYKYDFPANQKTQLSNSYRSLTGLDRDYDGVVWTYTYYTYKDTQTNQYKTWVNPNVDNSNGGWLIYGIENEAEDCGDNCEITIDPIYTSTIKSNLNHDLTLSYRPATKELKFQGEVAVGNSGCWSLGNEHAFVIKPYSNGTYDSFKLFYETKDSGAEICTSNIPTQVLNYSQDMSDLSAEGEQFLKNYISQKRFKESDVEKYTGMIPLG